MVMVGSESNRVMNILWDLFLIYNLNNISYKFFFVSWNFGNKDRSRHKFLFSWNKIEKRILNTFGLSILHKVDFVKQIEKNYFLFDLIHIDLCQFRNLSSKSSIILISNCR